MKRIASVTVVAVMAAAGCGSDADNLTLDGADDLKQCDIHAAHDKFAQAHADDPDHPQAALGYALTSLALLPEDPIVTEMLMRVGFTSAIDMQALVFGPDGVLARNARGDTCDSIDTFVDATVPYPPLATPSIDGWSLVDPTLTGSDFADAASRLSPHLGDIAEALETAATGMAGPIEIEGGCGLGKLTLQAPELYAGAAIIEGVRSAIQLGQAYDWAIVIKDAGEIWDGDAAPIATLLNAHLGRVVAAGEGAAAKPILAHGLELAVKALDAAKSATAAPDGLFDWTAVPASLLDNSRKLVLAGQAMLDASTAIPDVMPVLALDLASIFASPPDLQSYGTPLVEVIDQYTWDWSGDVIQHVMTPLFSPDPFVDTAPEYTWTLSDQYNAFDTTPVTMPLDRYDAVYSCMATTSP